MSLRKEIKRLSSEVDNLHSSQDKFVASFRFNKTIPDSEIIINFWLSYGERQKEIGEKINAIKSIHQQIEGVKSKRKLSP